LAQALAGCSAGSTTSAPAHATAANPTPTAAAAAPKAPDPCDLITDAEASAALGGPAQHKTVEPKDASAGGVVVTETGCSFDLITSDQSGHGFVIAVYAGAGRQYFDGVRTSDMPAVTGLGDAAIGNSQEVDVFSKSTMFKVYGSLGATDGLQQIARLAIVKL
jgi:hypothetical protein